MMSSKKQIHGGELRESRFFWQQNIETYIKLRVERVKVLFAKKDKNLYQTNCNCSGFRNRDYNDNWSANNRLLDNRLVSTTYIKILIMLAIINLTSVTRLQSAVGFELN